MKDEKDKINIIKQYRKILKIKELKYIDSLLQNRIEELKNNPRRNGIQMAINCKSKIEKLIKIKKKGE